MSPAWLAINPAGVEKLFFLKSAETLRLSFVMKLTISFSQ